MEKGPAAHTGHVHHVLGECVSLDVQYTRTALFFSGPSFAYYQVAQLINMYMCLQPCLIAYQA
jgi:hypothetical protein